MDELSLHSPGAALSGRACSESLSDLFAKGSGFLESVIRVADLVAGHLKRRSDGRRTEAVEGRYEIALRQRLFQQPQRAPDAALVDRSAVQPPEGARVVDVFRTASQHLCDQEIGDVNERQQDAADVRPARAAPSAAQRRLVESARRSRSANRTCAPRSARRLSSSGQDGVWKRTC